MVLSELVEVKLDDVDKAVDVAGESVGVTAVVAVRKERISDNVTGSVVLAGVTGVRLCRVKEQMSAATNGGDGVHASVKAN